VETELTKPEAAKTKITEEETEELESEAKTPKAPEAPKAEEAAEEEEEIEIVEEKFYDLNLRRIWTAPREKRTVSCGIGESANPRERLGFAWSKTKQAKSSCFRVRENE